MPNFFMSLLIFIYAVSSGKDVFVSMPLMPPVIFFYIDILAYISEFPLILPVSENTNISNTLLLLKIGCCWYTTVASYKKLYIGRRISVYHRFYLWWEQHVVTNIICFRKYRSNTVRNLSNELANSSKIYEIKLNLRKLCRQSNFCLV
jgi:hypothetical protein